MRNFLMRKKFSIIYYYYHISVHCYYNFVSVGVKPIKLPIKLGAVLCHLGAESAHVSAAADQDWRKWAKVSGVLPLLSLQ